MKKEKYNQVIYEVKISVKIPEKSWSIKLESPEDCGKRLCFRKIFQEGKKAII